MFQSVGAARRLKVKDVAHMAQETPAEPEEEAFGDWGGDDEEDHEAVTHDTPLKTGNS